MALVVLEGLDKTGKSTVAEHFRQKERYEYIHMTAPAKWHTSESYFAEMVHLIASTVGKNVVLDRSWCGELVWPGVFGRAPLLNSEQCANLFTIAKSIHVGHADVKRIYMFDPDEKAHLERIVRFKEPSYDFKKARELYADMAKKLDFGCLTFQEAETKGWT